MIMKKGFTLVELLAVIGLMGLMGAIAIGGYSAVVRGMSDRAALDAAKGIVDAARQRANLDRKKTYVFLFDEVVKVDSEMSAGIVNGLAIAVRPVGRVSAVVGDLICDEFGDLAGTYASLGSEDGSSESEMESSASTMRLYSIAHKNYALVMEGVFKTSSQVNRTLETEDDSSSGSGDSGSGVAGEDWVNRSFYYYGFKKVGGDATFNAGEEYGQEFAVVRLPPGYTFSGSVQMSGASSLGQKFLRVVELPPTGNVSPGVMIYRRKPNGDFESIGSTTQIEDGE
jgi:prepilin-type N-terminal cleavage/methylation domain-containing protein